MAYLIGTAGHVDHGKTTLLAALTGIDADRLPEEKARGMTIDIGFAYIDLPKAGRVSIVDVPGHERFIKNMLAGASGVDVALLCVAADEGVMPQTREHFQILQLLEASRLVIALTKCDIADEATQDIAELDVRELLEGTEFAQAPIVRVSAQARTGLDELRDALESSLISLGPRRVDDATWLMPIDRVFTVAGHGTIVTGTLARGCVRAGFDGEILPGGDKVRVRSVQTHGVPSECAEAGQRTALNVSGIRKENLHRGQAIGSAGALFESTCLNVRLKALARVGHGTRVRAHIGSGEHIGKLFLFDHAPGYVQLRLEQPVACAKGQRLVLRRYSPPDLLAGGEIITPNARARRKGDPEIQSILASDAPAGDSEREPIAAFVSAHPSGVSTDRVCEAIGASAQELGDRFEALKASGELLGFAGMWLSNDHYSDLSARLRETALALHADTPREPAVKKAALNAACGLNWPPKSFDRLVARLDEDGLLVLHDGAVRHPDFKIGLTDKQRELLERTVESMAAGKAIAPDAAALSSALSVPPQAIEEMWRLGVATGDIVKVDEGLYYPRVTLDELHSLLKGLGERFTVAQFRDATGSSRKFALPLLQWFDEARITKRVGDERLVLR